MNTALGELEFKLLKDQVTKLLAQTNRNFFIVVKNPNGSKYTFYEGIYSSINDKQEEESQTLKYQKEIGRLNKEITKLKVEGKKLNDKINRMSTRLLTISTSDVYGNISSGNVTISTKVAELSNQVKELEYENQILTKKNVSLTKYEVTIKNPRKPTKTVTPTKELNKVDYDRMRGTEVKRIPSQPDKNVATQDRRAL